MKIHWFYNTEKFKQEVFRYTTFAWCGINSESLYVTFNKKRVTCKHCLKKLKLYEN